MGLFGKSKKDENKDVTEEKVVTPKEEKVSDVEMPEIKGNWLASQGGAAGGNQVIRSFYVSEKASILIGMNQYVFKVFSNSNKAEVKKQVEKVFEVKVKDVKILNMPKKRRDIGRHPGFKQGFKKAIVILQEGYSIDQAKA